MVSGRTNEPVRPFTKKIGAVASAMISVAYSSGPRTSRDARRMVASFDSSPGWSSPAAMARGCCWRRRLMLSTSTMASSTTTPRAIARPASSIVLNVTPRR